MKGSFPLSWRRVLKFTGISALVIFLLFGAASWFVFRQRNSLVLEQLQGYANQNQSGRFSFGSINLRIFRDFPDISIEFDSVTYFEGYDSLRHQYEKSIFHVDKAYVAVRLWPLINDRVEISEISVNDGFINLVEYSPGEFNINRALEKPKRQKQAPARKKLPAPKLPPTSKKQPVAQPEPPITIDLEEISVNNIRIQWLSFGRDENNSILVRGVDASFSRSNDLLEIALQSSHEIDTVRVGNTLLPSGAVSFEANGEWDEAAEVLVVRETRLSLDAFAFAASGKYDHKANGRLDLQISAKSNDLPLMESLLRQEIIQNNKDLLRSGELSVTGKVFGELKNRTPLFNLEFGARNLSFRLPGKYGSCRDFGFKGKLVSGEAPDYSGASLHISQLKGEVPGGLVEGDIRISNAVSPWLQCKLDAAFTLDGFDKVFRQSRVEELEGTIETHLRFNGPMEIPWPGEQGPKATFDGRFNISRLSFLVGGTPHRFRNLECRGRFTSGDKPDQSEAIVELTDLNGEIPGGKLKGEIRISNFADPILHYGLSTDVDLEGYDEVFQSTLLHDLRGRAKADLRFDGPLALIGTHAMDSSRSSYLRLDSVSFALSRANKRVSAFNAVLRNKNNLAALGLSLRCGESDFQLDAKVENLMHHLLGKERIVQATGRVSSKELFTEDIIFDSARLPIVDDRITDLGFNFTLTNDLERQDTLDELRFQFAIRDLSAKFDKMPDLLDLDANGKFRLAEGIVSMSLRKFNLVLPEGRVDVSGDMTIPRRRQLEASAKVKLDGLPWQYITVLMDEVKKGSAASRKYLPDEIDKLTGELQVAASLRTYPLDFHKLEIRNSKLRFVTAENKAFSAAEIEASLEPLYFNHHAQSGAITGLRSTSGTLVLNGLKILGLIELNTSFTLDGRDDSLTMDFVSASRKATREDGSILINLSGDQPAVKFLYEVRTTPVASIIQRFSSKGFLNGDISYTMLFQTSGKTLESLGRNLEGSVDIRSDSLILFGVDIDDALTKYEKSQKFNLADLGAVILAGPIGIVATKGSDFVALAAIDVNNKKQTYIQELKAAWKLDNLVLQTTDLAFATNRNRIAIDGAIDIGRDSIPGIRIAVIDKSGCSLMDQQLYGKFNAVKKGKLNVAKTLFGSVINAVDAIVGKDCVPVYTGEVKNPNAKSKPKNVK